MKNFNLIKSLTRVNNIISLPFRKGLGLGRLFLFLSLAVFGVDSAWADWKGIESKQIDKNSYLKNGQWYVSYGTDEQTLEVHVIGSVWSRTLDLQGPASSVEFEAKKKASSQQNLKVAQSSDGSSFGSPFYDKNPGTTYESSGSHNLNSNTTTLKFYIETGATLTKYYRNVNAKMANYLGVTAVDKTSVSHDFGSAKVDEADVSQSFRIYYCNGGAYEGGVTNTTTLSITNTNTTNFSVDKTAVSINAGSFGYFDIIITYNHKNAGNNQSATITITDGGSYSATITATGTTTKHTPSMSWWSDENPKTISIEDGSITELVTDLPEGCEYNLSVSEGGYITIDNTTKTITPIAPTAQGQYITLTATVDNNYYYGKITKNIAVTDLKSQTIEWDQSFNNLKVGDAAISLTATAQTSITYQSSNTDVITINGNTMSIVGKGTAYVVATAAASTEYAQAMVQKAVIVRNPGESCAPYEETSGTFRSGHDLIMQWDFPATSVSYKITKPKNVGALREATIQELYDNAWHTVITFRPSNDGTSDTKSININSRAIRVTSNADNDMTVNSLRVDMTQYLNLSPSSLSMTATTTSSVQNSFKVDYANIQGPLEYSSTNPYISFSPTSGTTGDCGEWGSATINVTYAPAEVQNGDYTIMVWDGKTESLKRTIIVHCTSTATAQTMTWNQTFRTYKTTETIPAFTATTDAVRTDENTYPVVYTSLNPSIASITGNQLTILSGGKVTIRASQDGKDAKGRQRYTSVYVDTTITIEKVNPVVTFPTAKTITYGTALSNDLLIGGTASVSGSFAWVEVGQIKGAGTKAYNVTFTPDNIGWYNTITQPVTITINKADQTITWEAETNINLETPSASVLNATTTGDGSINYTIDASSDAGVGTITNNVLTLNKGGKLVINANAAATTNFNAATQVQKTFMVEKWGLTITWEDKDESGNVITTYTAGYGDIVNHFVARDEKTKEVVDVLVIITKSSDNDVIRILNNNLYVDCVGTATITATTEATDQYGAGSGEVTLTSLINTPVFTWQIPQPAPNSTYGNFFTSTNKESDCNLTFSSSDPSLAKVEGGKLIVGGNAETDTDVQITVTQNENCRWAKHTETFTIHVKKPANHVPFTITQSNYNEFKVGGSGAFSWDGGMKVGNGGGGFNWDDKTFILHFSGIPNKLSFSYNCTNVSLTVTNAEWFIQESADGQTWSAKNVISSSTSTSEQHLDAPIQLSPTTRYITFCYSGNFAGVFKNINVTELKYFYAAPAQTATEHVSSVEMGVYSGLGEFPVKKTIYLRHANAGSDLKITIGDTENFRLEYKISTGTDQMGDDPITIIYEPRDFGTHNTTITIHDGQNTDIVIPINAAAQPGATYTFIGGDGDAGKLENWQVGGITPTSLPNAYHTVEVQQPMIISTGMAFYKLNINSLYTAAKVTITPTGGLTVYNGGISGLTKDNFIIESSREHTGYFRVVPSVVSQWGTTPTATMQYASKGSLDSGANRDATWQYFGIPVDGADFTVDYVTWLYEWSEPNGWLDLKSKSQPVHLERFQGYAITQYGKPIYNFTGSLNMGEVDLHLTYTEGNGMWGDNMFANSFPSPIDVKLFTEEDFENLDHKTIYLYNSGSWNQWNEGTQGGAWERLTDGAGAPGTFTAIPALAAPYLETEQTLIAPMQGMCIHTDQPSGAIVHLDYAKHVWDAMPTGSKDDMNAPLLAPTRKQSSQKPESISDEVWDNIQYAQARCDSIAEAHRQKVEELRHRVRLTVYGENSGVDHIYLLEKDGFTAEYDNGYDARKMFSEGLVNLYTVETDGEMAVSASDCIAGTYIGMTASDDDTYTLKVSSVIGDSLYLKDLTNNVEIPLIEGQNYSFNMMAGSTNHNRFIIVEHPKQESFITTSNEPSPADVYMWFDTYDLHIENINASSIVSLYASDGKLLYNTKVSHSTTIPIHDLPNGVYVVKVNDQLMKFVKH